MKILNKKSARDVKVTVRPSSSGIVSLQFHPITTSRRFSARASMLFIATGTHVGAVFLLEAYQSSVDGFHQPDRHGFDAKVFAPASMHELLHSQRDNDARR